MSMTEERMQFLEEQIPYLAEAAFKQAYLQALTSGSSVLISEEDALIAYLQGLGINRRYIIVEEVVAK